MSLLQSIFRRPDYDNRQVEVRDDVDQLKAKKPDLEARQRQGRELLWDKTVDRSALAEYRAARVAQKPYVYQTDMK